MSSRSWRNLSARVDRAVTAGHAGSHVCLAGKPALTEEDRWSRRSGLTGGEDGQMG